MHDRDTVHAHAHVSCTVVPSCLASTFLRPPTLLREFGAQSLLCTVSVHGSGCGRRRAPPRDSDAQSPHARERKCVTTRTTQHTPRARCSSARSLAATEVSSFVVQVESTDRTVQYKLNAQSLRLFGLHRDMNDAHRAGAKRLQNKNGWMNG